MTQLFVAQAHERVFDVLREMLMWMSQDEQWGCELRDINNYYSLDRVNTFSLRRKIAMHVHRVRRLRALIWVRSRSASPAAELRISFALGGVVHGEL